MIGNLLSIGASGALAAEVALNVTGQNIANAGTDGYVRRGMETTEVASASGWSTPHDISLSGVAVTGLTRNADGFLQSEARRTASDTARAVSTVAGLTDIESAVENSGLFTAIGNFQNAVTALNQNPVSTALRAGVIQTATTMASAFQIAGNGLSATQTGLQGEIGQGVSQVNALSSQLAAINARLSASAGSGAAASNVTTSDRATLMDQRDALLNQIGGYVNVATTINADGSANLTLGGVSGPPLVTGTKTNPLASSVNPDGTVALTVGTATVALSGGSIAGNQAALTQLTAIGSSLDGLAKSIATTVNTQQANGTNLAGNPGAPLFSGSTAATLGMATTSGAAIATAAAGSGANSADTTNLTALNAALTTLDPAGAMNTVLTTISGAVASAQTTQTTLKTLSNAAAGSLAAEAGVDLNAEAVNLVKFQQAFQASGKVMQVADTIFKSILSLSG